MRRIIFIVWLFVTALCLHAQEEPMFQLVNDNVYEPVPSSINIVDLDGDGLLEIVGFFDGQVGRVEQVESDSDTFGEMDYPGPFGHPPLRIKVMNIFDIDHDGLLDAITCEGLWNNDYTYYHYKQIEPGSIEFVDLGECSGASAHMRLTDLEADGRWDGFKCSVGFDGGSMIYYRQDADEYMGFQLIDGYYMGFYIQWGWRPQPAFGNIDGDDRVDMLFRDDHEAEFQWYEYNPDLQEFEWVMETSFDHSDSCPYVVLADYDHDGYDDIFEPGLYALILHRNIYAETHDTNEETIPASSSVIRSAYPNPFNPETTIKCSVAQGEHADLTIYNTRGQKIKSWKNLPSGEHQVSWNAENIASGIYLIRLQTDQHTDIKKVSLIK